MIYVYLFIAVIMALPTLVVIFGLLYSLKADDDGEKVWRDNIGRALSRLFASCFGVPDGRTFCGWTGQRVIESNNLSWKVYRVFIESFMWFDKGHCHETYLKEKEGN